MTFERPPTGKPFEFPRPVCRKTRGGWSEYVSHPPPGPHHGGVPPRVDTKRVRNGTSPGLSSMATYLAPWVEMHRPRRLFRGCGPAPTPQRPGGGCRSGGGRSGRAQEGRKGHFAKNRDLLPAPLPGRWGSLGVTGGVWWRRGRTEGPPCHFLTPCIPAGRALGPNYRTVLCHCHRIAMRRGHGPA